mmetsp:Transcript_134350/g.374459  ORF Transcript_134350/g.374459 Transcript_134350/m.374459 type:complete len:217 (+) Transcript_134350:297-947(+)
MVRWPRTPASQGRLPTQTWQPCCCRRWQAGAKSPCASRPTLMWVLCRARSRCSSPPERTGTTCARPSRAVCWVALTHHVFACSRQAEEAKNSPRSRSYVARPHKALVWSYPAASRSGPEVGASWGGMRTLTQRARRGGGITWHSPAALCSAWAPRTRSCRACCAALCRWSWKAAASLARRRSAGVSTIWTAASATWTASTSSVRRRRAEAASRITT